jgi:hypothetical protein
MDVGREWLAAQRWAAIGVGGKGHGLPDRGTGDGILQL